MPPVEDFAALRQRRRYSLPSGHLHHLTTHLRALDEARHVLHGVHVSEGVSQSQLPQVIPAPREDSTALCQSQRMAKTSADLNHLLSLEGLPYGLRSECVLVAPVGSNAKPSVGRNSAGPDLPLGSVEEEGVYLSAVHLVHEHVGIAKRMNQSAECVDEEIT